MAEQINTSRPEPGPLYCSPWFYAAFVNAVLLLVWSLPIGTSIGFRLLILTPIVAIPFAPMAAGWNDRILREVNRMPPRIMFVIASIVLTPINLIAFTVRLAA